MLISEKVLEAKVLEAFDLKIEEWNREIDLERLCPNYIKIKEKVILETSRIYSQSDIELKDLELLKSNKRRTKNRWLKSHNINIKSMAKLNEWSNINQPLIMFPYIYEKTGKTLTSAIKNDMTIELYELILNKDEIQKHISNKNEKRELSYMAYSLTKMPFNNSKKGSFKEVAEVLSLVDKSVTATENSITTSKYNFYVTLGEDAKTMAEFTKPENTKKALSKINQLINMVDREIYNYILSRKGLGFVKNGIIVVPKIDIINNVFKSKGKSSYESLETSIEKLSNIKGRIGGSVYYTEIGLISRKSTIIEEGVESFSIEIHSYIRDEIIKKETINLYKDIIDTCPNSDCEVILFFLQRKRLGLMLSKEPLTITVNYNDYFSEVLVLSNKRKDRNISRILDALEFIKNTNSVLRDYERKKDDITLVFKEMTDNELADLNYEDIFTDKYAEFRSKLIGEPIHEVII